MYCSVGVKGNQIFLRCSVVGLNMYIYGYMVVVCTYFYLDIIAASDSYLDPGLLCSKFCPLIMLLSSAQNFDLLCSCVYII